MRAPAAPSIAAFPTGLALAGRGSKPAEVPDLEATAVPQGTSPQPTPQP